MSRPAIVRRLFYFYKSQFYFIYLYHTDHCFEKRNLKLMFPVLPKHKIVLYFITVMIMASCGVNNNLTQTLANPKGVTKLTMRNNGIKVLPPGVVKLKELKELYLFNTELDSLPYNIGELINLEKLVVSSNKLTSIPASIGNLKKLKVLSLKNNHIAALPSEIGNLTELKEFDLQNNDLTILPSSICNLTKLVFFNLHDNMIKELPNDIGNMKLLRFFTIGKNNLTELPDAIGNMSALVELNVAFCGPLVNLPSTLNRCRNLEFIYIDNTIIVPYGITRGNPRLRIVNKSFSEM